MNTRWPRPARPRGRCRGGAGLRRRLIPIVPAVLGVLAAGGVAKADTWIERPVDGLVLRFRPGDEAAADAAALHVADHWRDLGALFGAPPGAPPIVRLHPTPDDLVAAQPLAIEVGGEWLVPSRPRRELSVLVPRPAGGGAGTALDAALLDGAVHAALARHLVADAARGHLPEALQEGIVRFLAPPSEAESARTATGIATLRSALAVGGVVPWAVLAAPAGLYEQPELALAESRAIAHFLAERRGVTALARLPAGAAEAAGWRTALEAGFGASPERLEAEWLAWLPGYLDHGWRWHALYDGALEAAEAAIARGDYAGAAVQLAGLGGHAERSGGDVAARHARLSALALDGERAMGDVAQARAQLDRGDYAEAAAAAERARERLEGLALPTPAAVAAQLLARARRGALASARLAKAEAAPAWAALGARRDADAAARDLAALGGDLAARHALTVRRVFDRLLQPLGALVVALGVVVTADALRRRQRPGSALG